LQRRSHLTIEDLVAEDNICLIYRGEEDQRGLVTPFLRKGLELGEKVLYVAYPIELARLREKLDLSPYQKRWQLVLADPQAYFKEGFDPDEMISILRKETELALAEGYSALRVACEMSWACNHLSFDKLLEYMAKLDNFVSKSQCLALSQYEQRHLEPEILHAILLSYPIIAIGTRIYENFHYLPPSGLTPLLAEARLIGLKDGQTRRIMLEQSLDESESRYKKLLDALQEGVWAFDKSGHTTFVNPRMAEMLDYTVEEMEGRHLFSFMDERWSEACKGYLERRRQGLKEQHEFQFLRKDGGRIFVVMETSPITDEDGDYAGAIAGVMDITKRKQAEEELRNYKENLEELVNEKTEMLKQAERLAAIGETAAMVGHDLRNPLQVLSVTIHIVKEMLRSGSLKPEAKPSPTELFETMEESASYMNRLLSDLEDYARPLTPKLEKTNLYAVSIKLK
jgi:PAS domain S-box-containing protein